MFVTAVRQCDMCTTGHNIFKLSRVQYHCQGLVRVIFKEVISYLSHFILKANENIYVLVSI